MREVSISVNALKTLIERSFEKDVEQLAETMVLTRPGMSNPGAAFEFAGLKHQARPEAQKQVELRYRNLLKALESGENISEALSSFVGYQGA